MSMTDPIADFLTRIRNALVVQKDRVDIPFSRLKRGLSELLKQEGYIDDFEVVEQQPQNLLRLYLRYNRQGRPAILRLARVSRPGRRVYRGADAIKPVLNGLGVALVSTSRGLMSDRQAREERVGGEVLCEIW